MNHLPNASQVPKSVNTILFFPRGIIIGSNGGCVSLYEKGDDIPIPTLTGGGVTAPLPTSAISTNRDALRKTREFTLVEDGSAITKLALSPTEEAFLCTTEKSQLYHGSMATSDKVLD